MHLLFIITADIQFQGEQLAQELGSRCSFMQISSSSSSDAKKVLTQMIMSINKSGPTRNRRMSKIARQVF